MRWYTSESKMYVMGKVVKMNDAVLQQWWSETLMTSGKMIAPTPEHENAKEFGEWRDVEAVQE